MLREDTIKIVKSTAPILQEHGELRYEPTQKRIRGKLDELLEF